MIRRDVTSVTCLNKQSKLTEPVSMSLCRLERPLRSSLTDPHLHPRIAEDLILVGREAPGGLLLPLLTMKATS